jgi:hypothetical protein
VRGQAVIRNKDYGDTRKPRCNCVNYPAWLTTYGARSDYTKITKIDHPHACPSSFNRRRKLRCCCVDDPDEVSHLYTLERETFGFEETGDVADICIVF